MTDTTSGVRAVPRLPFERPDALHASPMFSGLRQQGPMVRVTTPTGDPAWLVVAYDEARQAFADRRLGYFVRLGRTRQIEVVPIRPTPETRAGTGRATSGRRPLVAPYAETSG